MDKPEFIYTLFIATTPEKLWQALTTAEFTQQYWGGRRHATDWQVGSPVKILKPDGTSEVQGEILQAEPYKMLSYSWQSAVLGQQPSRVTFELSPYPASEGSIVMLKITHDHFAPEANIALATMGWMAILNNLKTLLETGKPLPYAWRG
ncbi:MAG TPA: SRPBCC family protein [Caldilineaceae bacterium]|nr:SRPBCC family protein [Caldilineaceae bacterium]